MSRHELVLLEAEVFSEDVDRLGELLQDEVRVEPIFAGSPTAGQLSEVTIYVGEVVPAAITDAPMLKHLVVPFAGVSASHQNLVRQRPELTVHNSHYNAPFVAQHALALLLAAISRLVQADAALRTGNWTGRYGEEYRFPLVSDLTCLILGYGHIGKLLARHLQSLGARVVAVRQRASGSYDDEGILVVPASEMPARLAIADAVLSTLPENPATVGTIDADFLAACRNGAVLVNVGRGNTIVAEDLYEALTSGQLKHAALDVWWRYPAGNTDRTDTLPSDVPFHLLDNVTMSPHRANRGTGEFELRVRESARIVSSLLQGGNVNRVDMDIGY